MNNKHEAIKKAMEPGKYYSFTELLEKSFPYSFATSGQYLRAWQDLIISGTLQEGADSRFRINQ